MDFSTIDKELSEVPFADLTLPPSLKQKVFGGEVEATTIDYRRLRVRMGDRPLSWKLNEVYLENHSELPAELELLDSYDVWMIAHSVSVLDRGEFATFKASRVEAIGYEASFDSSLVYNVGLLPNPEVVSNIGGHLRVAATLGVGGEVEQSLDDTPGDILIGDAKIKASVEAGIIGKLDFAVWTPKISTSGICSSRCEWFLNEVDEPLLNTQMLFQVAIVPAGLKKLSFKIKGYALIRSIGYIPFPTKFETEWVDVTTTPVGSFKK